MPVPALHDAQGDKIYLRQHLVGVKHRVVVWPHKPRQNFRYISAEIN
jgi:hypothetical protein